MPTAFSLSPNRPNPVRTGTTFRYALPEDAHVSLEVFDVSGRRVATVVKGRERAGFKTVRWNAGTLPSGTYFYRLRAGSFLEERRLVVVR